MTKYCPSCGKKIEDDEIYCDNCGKKVSGYVNINNNKNDSEIILAKSETNPMCLIWPVLVMLIGFVLMISVIVNSFYFYFAVLWPEAIIILIGFIWFIIRYIAVSRSELVLTNKIVRGKCGLIFTKEMESPLNKISSVYISTGLIGNLFGYGTIGLATDSAIYKFKFIKDRAILKSAIFKQIQAVNEENMVKQAEEIAKAIKKN